MKKIYCVKLMNTHGTSGIQERDYFLLRFKDKEHDLLTLIKEALTGFCVYQSIESPLKPSSLVKVEPGNYYTVQTASALAGKTVAIEIPQADMLSVNVCFTKHLDGSGLFDLISLVDEAYLYQLLSAEVCVPGDALAEGNDQFMTVDPNPELRKNLPVPLPQQPYQYPGYTAPQESLYQTPSKYPTPMFSPNPMGMGEPSGHPYPVGKAMMDDQPQVAEMMSSKTPVELDEKERLIPLADFLDKFSEELHAELVNNGYSKARATNQLNRLNVEFPTVKRAADKVIRSSGLATTVEIDGKPVGIPYIAVDFNQM
ncbi:hypothetical protein pEaSNUABM37_00232 [Erwinia phage pEa_SNUABM_37]|nr:hypothetical protein pEaSNUABM37_00232 [Erwinia phage pEa_SNUABM_37]QXO10700.1 hypothetical protein pEaSNUABM48_00232 [Erwinia phage pEa_SNUABM_48]